MTRLILPSDEDQIVTRMIQDIELHRSVRLPDPPAIRVYQRPPPIEKVPEPEESISTPREIHPGSAAQTAPEESADTAERARFIDWWAEARKVTQEADEEALQRWLLEQGFDSYVSIMRGELPITNPVETESPLTQENKTGYLNTYGDMEYAISENCVATTQVAARFDHSDFGKALPMRITCKRRSLKKYDFERRNQE